MPSKSSGLRVSGTFSLNSSSSQREAVTLSDTQELAGARTPAPGWDMTQVSRCWPWQPLAFPRKVLQSPPGFPQTTRPGHRGWLASPCRKTNEDQRDTPTALCPEGVTGRQNGAREGVAAAHSKYTTWLSPKPLSQRGKEKAASGCRSLPVSLDQEPVDRGGTCLQAPSKTGWRDTVWRRHEQLLCACSQEAQGEWPEML